jgi:hypothetical protein
VFWQNFMCAGGTEAISWRVCVRACVRVCVTFSQKVGYSNNKETRVHKLVACQQRTYHTAGLPSGHLVSVEAGLSVQKWSKQRASNRDAR